MLLPLDSPHWHDLTACWSAERAIELLRQIVSTGRLGEAWDQLHEEITHQGSVYGVTSAALPHLIRLAPSLTPVEQHNLWIEIGLLITAGADSFDGKEPVPGMQETLTQSLRDAEPIALQAFLDSPSLDASDASYLALACVALSGHTVGRAIWEFLAPGDGYVRLKCSECDADECDVDGFGDPVRPPCAPPPVPALTPRARPEWARVPTDLPPGFEGFSAVARAVADAGLPGQAPAAAVWCLVAAMVASKGDLPWARTLLRLTGHFRCGTCGSVQPIATMLDHAPVDSLGSSQPDTAAPPAMGSPEMADPDPATVADEAGFKPAPGDSVSAVQITLRPVQVPGDVQIPARCEALVTMPDGRLDARVPWLDKLRDGRTLLATGHADGAVHLRHPLSRNSFGELWRREGQPVAGMAFGQDLVVVYGSLDVDVWSPIAVSGERSSMAPKAEYLHANGHRHIVAVCVATDLGYRKPILLADRNGTVSMWETFGVRLGDPLPPDPRHREVFAIAASAGFVVTASRADANLRIWQPLSGMCSLMPLEAAPQWLNFTGDTLTIGLTTGPVSFSVR
ncbi:hypothetical protein CQ14_29050 [Bradyrhizobium lablabi]|uniref:Uncharacterized protein n=1 Tax=Bradyrhizobium lablabi TaxID=722472 RepID=A0A0R3M7T1_9BRAD|nr:hypothetical protein [Bradyrhizobium lablabi]KRR15916.1 hypothetical protein CQ14_29050 [Bradyrhizobium lablabi]